MDIYWGRLRDLMQNQECPENSRMVLNSLGVVFVILLFLGCFAVGAHYSLLNPEFYQTAMDEEKIYEQLPTAYAQAIDDGTTIDAQGISQVIPVEIVQVILPQAWVQEQTQGLVTSIIDYLNLRTPAFSYTLNLAAVKEVLQGDARTEIATGILSRLPDCTMEVVSQLANALQQGSFSQLEACNPPEPLYNLVLPLVETMVSSTGSILPETITISRSSEAEEESTQSKFTQNYRWIRLVLGLVPWGILVVGLCLAVIGFSGTRYAFRVMGLSGIVAGVAAILGAVLFSGATGLMLLPLSEATGIPLIQALITLVGKNLLMGYGKMVILCSLGVTGMGILFLMVHRAAKKL